MSNSYFIVFEGIDGSGKGTQLKKTFNYLNESRRNHILTTNQPTYRKYGTEVREFLENDNDPYSNADKILDLLVKDRRDHINSVIKPFLNSADGGVNHIVLCDRYYFSTFAYQGAQGIEYKKIYDTQKEFIKSAKPDLTMLFHMRPGVAKQRMLKGRDEAEKFEEIEFMKKLCEQYNRLPMILDKNIVLIDGNNEPDKVFNDVVKTLQERLGI